jgi:hypothetical protein
MQTQRGLIGFGIIVVLGPITSHILADFSIVTRAVCVGMICGMAAVIALIFHARISSHFGRK